MSQRLGGLVMRVEGTLIFLPASVVGQVAPLPQVTRVAGAAEELLGIALHRDEIVPVVAIGPARDAMVICTWAGENIGLVGGDVLGAGMFEADGPSAVLFAGEHARSLDLGPICARVRSGRWGGRWGG